MPKSESTATINKILGISAFYHDSAAVILDEGKILAAAQEERFTRKKHDPSFPRHAINYCLAEGNLSLSDIDAVVFYDKPLLKFDRLLETYFGFAPRGFISFAKAMPVWLKEKLFLKETLRRELSELGALPVQQLPKLLFSNHHQSHAASAFYPSPFNHSAVLCLDGVGEWTTTSAWLGAENNLEPLWEIEFPHSLGMLYSAFTYFTGFRVNSGEYKLMGLAPYGTPKYIDRILDNLLDLKEDGSFRLDMQFFDYCTGLRMTNDKFAALFDGPARKPESQVTQREMDIAASIQKVTEEIVLRLATGLHAETGSKNLCLAGGVALNCVSNGRILREGPFEKIWIQPAAGDAGGALGAAAVAWHSYAGQQRTVELPDKMHGAYLGPRFSNSEVQQILQAQNAVYQRLDDEDLFGNVADALANEKVVGWFQGRMEFGPRALGGRSILGDPRSEKMQSIMNLKIKYRESFRPFAPSVLSDDVATYFEQYSESPYMLIVAPVQKSIRKELDSLNEDLFGIDKLKVIRSDLPAITHVDYSARVQTVHKETNPRYHDLISAFKKKTDCGVVINTSFNVRGEPIVCTPEDAYRCFMRTDMDILVVENFVMYKDQQPELQKDESWMQEFELD